MIEVHRNHFFHLPLVELLLSKIVTIDMGEAVSGLSAEDEK